METDHLGEREFQTRENDKRLASEARVLRATVKELLALGYALSVFDGEEITVRRSQDARKIFAALRTTDEDHLRVYSGAVYVGWVRFVYGNAPHEVINDYTVNLTTALEPVMELCDKLAA